MTEDREMTITNKDGSQITVIAQVTTEEGGIDKDGNIIRSVKINVPTAAMGAVGGQQG